MVIILVLTLLTFGIVTVAIVSGYSWLSAESPVAQRLKTLVPDLDAQAQAKKKGPSVGARLLALLGTYSFGGSENSLAKRLAYAGIRGPRARGVFLRMRPPFRLGPAARGRAPRAGRPQRRRGPEGACRSHHPERSARREHGADATLARRPAAHQAPAACGRARPQAADQDALSPGLLHPAGALHRGRWARHAALEGSGRPGRQSLSARPGADERSRAPRARREQRDRT